MPLETMTKTSTVTNTKLLVATLALAAAGGLAFMLAPNYNYAYKTTSYTVVSNALVPTAPRITAHTSNSLYAAIGGGDGNTLSTVYAIHEPLPFAVATSNFVQADGTLKANSDLVNQYGSAVYQTAAQWATINVAGFLPNTPHVFNVDAKTSNGIHSGWGPNTSRYTAANSPTAPVISGITNSTLYLTLGAGDGNPAGTIYAITETTSNRYVQADGSLNAFLALNTLAGWGTVTVSGLQSSTTYTFTATALNNEYLTTPPSPPVSATTK